MSTELSPVAEVAHRVARTPEQAHREGINIALKDYRDACTNARIMIRNGRLSEALELVLDYGNAVARAVGEDAPEHPLGPLVVRQPIGAGRVESPELIHDDDGAA